MGKTALVLGKNRVALSRVTLAALVATGVGSLVPISANAAPPTTVPYTYTTGTTVLSGGATSVTTSGGNLVDDNVVATDYGQISNIFLTRFTPALVACGIAGAILFAAKGGVRMVHGWLAGAFH